MDYQTIVWYVDKEVGEGPRLKSPKMETSVCWLKMDLLTLNLFFNFFLNFLSFTFSLKFFENQA